jgi:uncharacterized protein YidB (DUF937 family)
MPIGERIGQAYVKVILDGGNQKDFGDQLRAAGETAGRDSAFGSAEEFDKTWTKELRRRIKKSSPLLAKHVRTDLARQFQRTALIEKELGSTWFQNFEKGVRDRVKNTDIADVMLREVRRKFVQSGGNRGLIESMLGDDQSGLGRFRQLLDSAAAEVERVRTAEARKSEADQKKLEAGLKSLSKEAERFSIFIEKSGKNFITTNAEVIQLRGEVNRLRTGLEQAFDQDVINELDFNRLRRDLDHFHTSLDTTDVVMNRFRLRTTQTANTLGRAFGRGARNDFINLIGAVVRGFSLATTRVVEFGGRFARVFADGFKNAEEGTSRLMGGFRALGQRALPILRKLASPAGLGAMLVVIPIVVHLLGGLTTAFVSLGGGVTAVASSIVGGLVGGLGILAGLLLPVVAGVGGLTAAILLMDEKTKAATKQAIQPFVDQMKELAQITASEAFKNLPVNAERISKAFDSTVFRNFAKEIGMGLDEIQTKLTNAFTSDKFSDFIATMGPQFRKQLGNLTDIVIEFGAGFGGVFVAIQPQIDRFLARLEGVGREFNTWANSVGGQTALRTFFDLAEQSLASISGLVVDVSRAFAVMFNNGAGAAGIQLIEDMRLKVQQFIQFMRQNPELVNEFFAGAVQIARDFGNIILSIIGVFRQLNSEANRNIAHGILVGIAGAIDLISAALKFIDYTPIGLLIDFVFGFEDAMRRVSGTLATLIGGVATLFGALANLPRKFGGDVFAGWETSLRGTQANLQLLNQTPIKPAVDLSGVLKFDSALLGATKTIQLTQEEMKALGIEIEKPKNPNINVSSLDTAKGKINEVTTAALDLARSLDPANGLGGLTVFLSQLQTGLGGLASGGKTTIPIKPTVDPGALGTATSQVSSAFAATPAVVKPTMDPASVSTSVSTIKNNLASIKPKPINISAGGNAQGVINRTKNALDGLVKTKQALVITAGGNAQAVIGRTKAALDALMKTKTKIDISAGGNAQAVIARTQSALNNLDTTKTITIKVNKVGSGASLVKRGAVISSMARGGFVERMAAGGFANFQQFIRPDIIAGESGREAVVPLSRPLSQVDPSVRMLSAIAQGKVDLGGGGPRIDASGWTIVSPSNPAAVADEVINRITGMAY